jgi:hypothetical protein
MEALRTTMRDYFWDGEFRDKLGGNVLTADGKDHNDYAVFTGTNGKTGMVICNYDGQPVTVKPSFEKGSPSQYRLVDKESPQEIAGGVITIPGKSAVGVI